jgi:hypothetical protein
MALPGTVRVRLSTEDAGSVALTPVVSQELPLAELLERISAVTRKDLARTAEVLRRGTLVSGASRFRWQPLEAAGAELETALAALPADEPARAFAPERCVSVVLGGTAPRLELRREVAAGRRLLRRASFWEALLAEAPHPDYVHYLFRERADLYRAALDAAAAQRLRAAAALLKFSALERQVAAAHFDHLDLLVERAPGRARL